MKTILITGGASGLGKGVALHYLAAGDRVIAISNSTANGEAFMGEAKELGAEDRAGFFQADLSLVEETKRIVEAIKSDFPCLDVLAFFASKHSREFSETSEGFEVSFALDYMSRFILSYGLKKTLEKAHDPIIINVCGTGMKGNVNWNDLQHKSYFDPMKVMMHGSRLNELSGVAFASNDAIGKIKYILYNPMAVQTPGMMEFSNGAMKLYYTLAANPIEKAVLPIVILLDNPPATVLSAYKKNKNVSLDSPNFDKEYAIKLYSITKELLDSVG